MDHTLKTDSDVNRFENDYCKMELRSGILFCTYRPFLEITLEIAKVITRERVALAKGKIYPVFTDISNLKFITREAREYFASEEGVSNVSAGAYLAETQIEKFLWEMFLKINRPPVSCRIFSDKKEALVWLEKFK